MFVCVCVLFVHLQLWSVNIWNNKYRNWICTFALWNETLTRSVVWINPQPPIVIQQSKNMTFSNRIIVSWGVAAIVLTPSRHSITQASHDVCCQRKMKRRMLELFLVFLLPTPELLLCSGKLRHSCNWLLQTSFRWALFASNTICA